MAVVDQAPNELEQLLADVQRTIRENDLFIRSLKKEAVDAATDDSDEESDYDSAVDKDDYEEL
ncbi:MAG TPA: hypothetical protein HPP97_12020 [Desulfuromonadales bacterium]|nr:hypothetical protein [Desulfuromonadales bacterium]